MKNSNYNKVWNTPVLILGCKLGGLAIARTLGSLGVSIFGVDDDKKNPVIRSRYIKQYFIKQFNQKEAEEYLEYIIALTKIIGQKPILIPTSDDLSLFVSNNTDELKKYFLFPENSPDLLDRLANKQRMFDLALENNVPTPNVVAPKNLDDVMNAIPLITLPIMLKGIDGNKLLQRTGKKCQKSIRRQNLSKNILASSLPKIQI